MAQQAVAENANEITAIPDRLGMLDRHGAGGVDRCHGLPENHRPNHRGRGSR
jgi:hypothetical protein